MNINELCQKYPEYSQKVGKPSEIKLRQAFLALCAELGKDPGELADKAHQAEQSRLAGIHAQYELAKMKTQEYLNETISLGRKVLEMDDLIQLSYVEIANVDTLF